MLLDTYFYHLPRAIPAHECEDIIAYGKSLNPKEAKTFESKNMLSDEEKQHHSEKIRTSKTAFIKDMWLKKDLNYLVRYANKSWNFNLSFEEDVQFTEYEPRGHYNWHNDAIKNPMNLKNMMRKLSIVVQLSKPENYEGGGFKFNLRGLDSHTKDTIISPPPEFKQQGSVIVFPSFLWHKVEPITSGKRYSLVMWTLGEKWK
jgi:PKHD-type hydroxylase|tara:strand:+ start:433 stop:1038 length:606 start_codon:yes stop_codon:yes gene_type:complete